MDRTYGELIAALPPPQRTLAQGLFAHLGIEAGAGFGWDRFFQLGPNRELPVYAVPGGACAGPSLPRYIEAHHCLAFHGLLADRLADHQVSATPQLVALEASFRQRAIARLGEACGDARRAEAEVRQDQRRWAEGVAREQAALAAGALALEEYCDLILLKLDWVGTAAALLAEELAGVQRGLQFRSAHRLLLLSLQCLDDAMDVEDDRLTFGAAAADALRLPVGGLVRASGRLAFAAARVAGEAGFACFEEWLRGRAAELSGLGGPGSAVHNELAGISIAAALEERCLSGSAMSC